MVKQYNSNILKKNHANFISKLENEYDIVLKTLNRKTH